MDKTLLDKYKNNPSWGETIKLYSGLFGSKNDREQFILNLAESDVLLASECKTSSTDEEDKLTNTIEEKCHSILSTENASEKFSNALIALVNINKHNLIKDFIQTAKKRKIVVLRDVMSILPFNESSLELLSLILISNPNNYIKPFLNILYSLANDSIYLETETIQVIFKLLLSDNNIKAKYVLQFYRLNMNSINPGSYMKEAKEKIYYFNEYIDIVDWINIFKLDIKLKSIIIHLIGKNKSHKGYFTALSLLEKLTAKEKLSVLNIMFETNELEIQILLFIYLNVNYSYKLHFKNFKEFNAKINPNCLEVFDEFNLTFSKICNNAKENELFNRLKIGQIIELRYVSKRNNYHLLKSGIGSIPFLLPFEEVKTPVEFNINDNIEVKIIFIDYNKNEVYVSTRQLNIRNIAFNQNSLKRVNKNDIVKCKIGQRFENRVYVTIYGFSKKQKAVIYKNKILFEGIKHLDAKVINIMKDTIILEPIKLLTNANATSNIHSLIHIKENKVSDWDKIIEFLKSYSVGDTIQLQIFNTQIGYVLDRKIKQFFTSNKWLIMTLLKLGYISFEENKYTVIKNFESDLRDILKYRLSEEA